jgi:hypothetical protein
MKEEFVPPNSGEFCIGWEKWIDPFDNDEVEEAKRVITETYNKFAEETGADEDMIESSIPQYYQNIKTILTPFGVLPLVNSTLASNHFKFWIGHSNFKLYDVYLPIIKKVDGIESVEILTPYRFRISIGKMFKDREVMDNINKSMIKVAQKIKNETGN